MDRSEEKVSFISCGRGLPLDSEATDFPFDPPSYAPIFRPSEQEFAAGPLKYIASIRHLAEPFGICKIIPPAVSVHRFFWLLSNFSFAPGVK